MRRPGRTTGWQAGGDTDRDDAGGDRRCVPSLQDRDRLRARRQERCAAPRHSAGETASGFAIARPWLVPLVFGKRWLRVLMGDAFLALGAPAHGLFNMELSGLCVLR